MADQIQTTEEWQYGPSIARQVYDKHFEDGNDMAAVYEAVHAGKPCCCKSNEEVAAVLTASRAPVCPECRSGKHGNCDGTALDEAADDIVECRCPPAFHPEKRN